MMIVEIYLGFAGLNNHEELYLSGSKENPTEILWKSEWPNSLYFCWFNIELEENLSVCHFCFFSHQMFKMIIESKWRQ